MRRPKKIFNCLVLFFIFYFSFVGNGILYASTQEAEKSSFDFKNCSISEALGQIMKATGIEIVVQGDTGNRGLSKSYEDYPIEQILKDIFDGESFVMALNYRNEALDSIHIWILGEEKNTGDSKDQSSPAPFASAEKKGNKSVDRKKIALNNQATTVPPPRSPEKIGGLEPPPMPPGLHLMKK